MGTRKDCGKGIEELIPSYIARGQVKWEASFVKQFGTFQKNLNVALLHDPAIPLLGI